MDTQFFQIMFQKHSAIMLLIDPNDGQIVANNESASHFYGYTMAELNCLNLNDINILSPTEVAQIRQAALQQEHNEFILPHRLASGEIRIVEVHLSPIVWAGQTLLFMVNHDITDRLEVEKTLWNMQEQHFVQKLFEAMPTPICYKNIQGQYLAWNGAATALLNRPAAEIMGRTLFDVFPAEVACQHQAMDAALLAQPDTPQVYEINMYNYVLQEERTYLCTKSVLKNIGGKIMGIVAVMLDITKRKQTEVALRESEERWQFALEANGDGMWDWNIQTKQSFHSKRWKEMLGYAEDELGDSSDEWEKRLHPDDKAAIHEQLAAHLRGETPYYMQEYRLLHRDENYRWILARGKVMSWTADGKPLRMVGTHTDITERKQLENKLNQLTHAVKQSSSSIIIVNVMGQIEFVNEGFTQITGYSLAEVMGQNSRMLRPAQQLATFYQEMWATIEHGEGWQGEIVKQKKDGTLYWVSTHISVIKNLSGQITHYISVEDDITNRKHLEVQLQMANQQLLQAYDETLEGWARALDLRDKETEGHSRRVTEMTLKLAEAYGVAESDLQHIRRGALLHDIGKMGIPDNILLKTEPLTDQEWEIMKLHPLYAYELLQPIEYLEPALKIPYCHHEKWDGSGYPRRLKGEEIPLAARLFAFVDVWDALSFDRPYRQAWPQEKIKAHILALSGSHFDPQLIPLFLQLI